jgi:hypothetical protein
MSDRAFRMFRRKDLIPNTRLPEFDPANECIYRGATLYSEELGILRSSLAGRTYYRRRHGRKAGITTSKLSEMRNNCWRGDRRRCFRQHAQGAPGILKITNSLGQAFLEKSSVRRRTRVPGVQTPCCFFSPPACHGPPYWHDARRNVARARISSQAAANLVPRESQPVVPIAEAGAGQ